MTTTFDPVQLLEVTDCPVCKSARAFKPKGIFGQYWTKRCMSCRHSKDWPLPKITKKIIYLDQLVISNMVKAKQPFWTELHKKLSALAALELIVCPYSSIHREESLLSNELRDDLKRMYRSFGGSIRFRATHDIEQAQLLNAIRCWLGTADSRTSRPDWGEAFSEDPHTWNADFQTFADFPVHEPRVTDLRNRKQVLHANLEAVGDYWETAPATFEEDVKREAIAYGASLLEVYRELAGSRQRLEIMLPDDIPGMREAFNTAFGPDRFDPSMPPSWAPGAVIVHWLAAEVYHHNPDEKDPVGVVEQFFAWEHAFKTPFIDISSRLWAEIAQRRRSKKSPRMAQPSDSYDVSAIAHFAPYCDAMFVDNEFRGMATQKNVDVPREYGVQLFSMKTRNEFMAYLNVLCREMSDSHRFGLSLTYPHLASILQSGKGSC